jgi:hypothetical protein
MKTKEKRRRLRNLRPICDSISPETRVDMRKATAGIISGMKRSIGAELVDKVIAEASCAGKL